MTHTSRKALTLFSAAALAFGVLAQLSARGDASTPVIVRIVPAEPTPSAGPQVLAVEGREFQPGPTVILALPEGGTVSLKEKDIQGQSETYFRVAVLLDCEGTYSLTITNRDGGVSRPFSFDVRKDPRGLQMPSPAIEDVRPHELHRDPGAQTLRVTGRGFELGMRVHLTNPLGEDVTDLSVSKIANSSFELKALFVMAGDYELRLVNSSGAVSNIWRMTVQ
jgi:hypothetical protein